MTDPEFRNEVFRYIAGWQEQLELLRRIGQIQATLSEMKWPSATWSLDTLQDDMRSVDTLEAQLDSTRAAHMDAATRMRSADLVIRRELPQGVWYKCGMFAVRWYPDCQTQITTWREVQELERENQDPGGAGD